MLPTPDRAKSVFLAALEVPAGDARRAHVAVACGGDEALLREVDQLLRHHEAAGAFLDPAPGPAAPADRPGPPTTAAHTAAAESAGALVGPYKLLEEIGAGGMGAVWMAQQTEPVKRLVAVKLIKAGMDSRAVLARFEAERQALALMDHPNIARVLDAGATPDGRPFFVMELVKGRPVTAYCDEHRLTPRQRLELFVPVCQAIQHAHQKGVIHRDVKPNNVLVTMYDDKPVPKVIDFGVAKATGQQLTVCTPHTGFGAVVGTPEYMSPEQASFNQLDVDTRSDVYSLGVLLYELLAGSPPFSRKELEKAGLLEILRVVREQEPQKPSTKLSTADGLPGLAARRGTEPKKLCGLVRGELDWIVMKALEKDRSRRYDTANAIATDVQRYLADETVQACPPSTTYRLKKFLRRNKGPVLAVTTVLVALVGGIVGTTAGMVRAGWARQAEAERAAGERLAKDNEREQRELAEKRRDEAEQARKDEARARDQAEQEKRIAYAVRVLLEDRLLRQADVAEQAYDLLRAGGSSSQTKNNPTIRELLDRAAAELTPDKIEKQIPGQPRVQAEILQTIGNTYRGVGEFEKAIAHLGRARDLGIRHLGPGHTTTLGTLHDLAVAYWEAGRLTEAIRLCEQIRDEEAEKPGPDHPSTLRTLTTLAMLYRHAGRLPEAIRLGEQVRDRWTEHLGPDDRDTLIALHNLALAYQDAARLPEAVLLLERVRDALTGKLGPDHPHTLTAQANLAGALKDAGKAREAIDLLEQARDRAAEKLGPDHPLTLIVLSNLGRAYKADARLPDAVRLFEQARDRMTEISGPDHPNTLATLHNLALAYWAAGKRMEAIRLLEQVRERMIGKLGPDHPETLKTVNALASAYRDSGRLPEAIPMLEQVRDKRIEKLGPDHPDTLHTLVSLALAYRYGGNLPEAIRLLEQVRERMIGKLGPDHPKTVTVLHHLALAYLDARKLAEAIRAFEEVRDKLNDKPGPDTPDLLMVLNNLAVAYWSAKRLDLSVPLFERVLERRKVKLGPDHPETVLTMANLAVNYRDADRLADAVPLMEDALTRARKIPGPVPANLRRLPSDLAAMYDRAGLFAKSEPLYREFLEAARKQFGQDHPQTAGALAQLGLNLLRQKKSAAAEPVLRGCLAIREKKDPDAWMTFDTQSMLGGALLGQKKYADAEPLLLQGYEGLKRLEAKLPPQVRLVRLTDALVRLVQLYDSWGKKEQTLMWQKKLDAHDEALRQSPKPPDN
jgi:serine/threonine protein kinase/tetratricopeptide (TPR) repeat protein